MRRVPAGSFRMGSASHYADGAPAHRVRVAALDMAAADPETPACCTAESPRGPGLDGRDEPCQLGIPIPRRVVKGGSFLCAPSYCRHCPAALHAQMVDAGMSHIGFRCVRRPWSNCETTSSGSTPC